MKDGNKLGIAGCALLVLYAVLAHLAANIIWLLTLGAFVGSASIVFWILAVIRGSRWWFAIPVVMLCGSISVAWRAGV